MYSPRYVPSLAQTLLTPFIVLTLVMPPTAQTPAPTPAPAQTPAAQIPANQTPAVQNPQTPEMKSEPTKTETFRTPKEKAWSILKTGLAEDGAEKRAKAVNALGLLEGDAVAEKLAIAALNDEKANVRVAAATTLGVIHAQSAKLPLENLLDDSEPAVTLAAASSLLILNDNAGYEIYFAVLTGEKKASKGFIKEQMKILHDPKKMADMGVSGGLGFIPYAGLGYGAVKMVLKSEDSATLVKAAAARSLAHDPDASSGEALLTATTDKSWIVRAGALQAISERGDKALAAKIVNSLDDEKEDVRYIAAGSVIHLDSLRAKKSIAKTAKKS
jgi:HEAT repeat protein